jgi:phosphotransferase system enzyme I (PtsI)
MTLDAGVAAGIPVSMCGEMAGDVRYTPLLLGLGLREFSMPPAFILEVKESILNHSVVDLMRQVTALMVSADRIAIERFVAETALYPVSGARHDLAKPG